MLSANDDNITNTSIANNFETTSLNTDRLSLSNDIIVIVIPKIPNNIDEPINTFVAIFCII